MKKFFFIICIFSIDLFCKPGNLIFVRGIPNAGKTTLCKALQKSLPEPYYYFSTDILAQMIPKHYIHTKEGVFIEHCNDDKSPKAFFASGSIGLQFFRAFADCIKGLVENGHNVIVEAIVWQQSWLDEFKKSWKNLPLYTIKILIDEKIALVREETCEKPKHMQPAGIIRGALEILECVPMHYDLVLDSGNFSVDQEVQMVLDFLQKNTPKSLS